MADVYSREQISQFLEYIDVPPKFRLENEPKCDYAFLKALHVHMITAIPYENLTLHYSTRRVIDLDPQVLFDKMVGDARGRGGYCMENSLLLLHMLRGLGFRVFPTGVKIRLREDGVPQGSFIGWVHIVNIVTLEDGTRYMVDASFGGDGATKPIELKEGSTIRNMGTQDARLIRDFIPGQTERSEEWRKWWMYQCRNGPEKPWMDFYVFTDLVEWQRADFDISNFFTSSAANHQPKRVLVIKFLRREGEDGEQEVFGKRMLVNGTVKENTGGRTKLVKECRNEEERLVILRKWFGIGVTKEEEEAIKGLVSELPN